MNQKYGQIGNIGLQQFEKNEPGKMGILYKLEFQGEAKPEIKKVGDNNILKFCASKSLQSKYHSEFSKLKLQILQNVVNVGHQSTDGFPILINFRLGKQNKTRECRFKHGKKRMSCDFKEKSAEGSMIERGQMAKQQEHQEALTIQYMYSVFAKDISQARLSEQSKIFQQYTEKLHDYIMKTLIKMQISIELNKTTQKMIENIRQILRFKSN